MKGIHIRLEKQGLAASLFDLEAEIMDFVWSKGEEFTVADVTDELQKRRQIAYTTVMTTVHRLFDKELLTRRKEGRRHVYRPVMDRDTFHQTMARQVLETLPPSAGKSVALAMLIEQVSEADLDELDQLEALIQAKRKELEP